MNTLHALSLPRSRSRRWALLALAAFFFVAGVNHFVAPAFYTAMMPPQLPAGAALAYLAGVLEMAGAAGALMPRTRSAAGFCLVVLLVAVFPANVYMALAPERFEMSAAALYARLPFQAVFIVWAWWATRSEP